jgi:hypothetical protein
MDPGTMMALASVAGPLVGSLFGGGGQRDSIKKLPTKNKGQLSLLDRMITDLTKGGGYQNAFGMLQGLLDPNSEIYKSFAEPYQQNFEQQTVPRLAEQFAGYGGGMGGGLSSSGFGQALGAAGGNLQAQLAQMMAGLRTNAAQGIMGQANQALSVDPFAYLSRQGSPGGIQSMLAGVAPGLANWGMNYLSNRPGMGGQGGMNQSPLTNTYDQMFRSGAMT